MVNFQTLGVVAYVFYLLLPGLETLLIFRYIATYNDQAACPRG